MGLLINARVVDVPDVKIHTRADAAWAYLGSGDCRPRTRRTSMGMLIPPQLIVLHKTIADDPEKLIAGAGPSFRAGGEQDVAESWQQDPSYSGAHIVVGYDGTAACLADLLLVEAFHATTANPYSVGIETKELHGGGFYVASAQSMVSIVVTICDELGIQKQMPHLGSYKNRPIQRMINGGHDCVGVVGHRDQTDRRGRWDPGDYEFQLLAAHGFEQYDFDAGEDLATWKSRQLMLNSKGHNLVIDGVPGPATRGALLAEGYKNGIWVNGRS